MAGALCLREQIKILKTSSSNIDGDGGKNAGLHKSGDMSQRGSTVSSE